MLILIWILIKIWILNQIFIHSLTVCYSVIECEYASVPLNVVLDVNFDVYLNQPRFNISSLFLSLIFRTKTKQLRNCKQMGKFGDRKKNVNCRSLFHTVLQSR